MNRDCLLSLPKETLNQLLKVLEVGKVRLNNSLLAINTFNAISSFMQKAFSVPFLPNKYPKQLIPVIVAKLEC